MSAPMVKNRPLPTQRSALLQRLSDAPAFDLVVAGGGATGLGLALDATARGFRVLLLEAHDFAKGTSSRATKLVHGGVRYLAQGDIGLVREALHERATLLANAPHLARPLPFVIPSYAWWQTPFHAAGLKLYDALAGSAGLGATEVLDLARTKALLPTARTAGLRGGVRYWDGQFDDARLALALARTAAERGALVLNYCRVVELLHEQGRVVGVVCEDLETGGRHAVRSRCVVNATGVWVDALRRLDAEARGRPTSALVTPSQGVHLVVDRAFLPTDHALMVPRTSDGRVLFAVPWLGKTILGTTDTPRESPDAEPRPFPQEVEFILGEAGRYLSTPPRRADVRSIWVGLRPLVRPQAGDGETATKSISREHTVRVAASGLVSVTGGKWTTYRSMAEDVLDHCFDAGLLPWRSGGVTRELRLVGAMSVAGGRTSLTGAPDALAYGDEAEHVLALEGSGIELGGGLTAAMVRFAVRHEYARTVEDVLARRHRLLFLDARQAAAVAPAVATLLREETGRDPGLAAFVALARTYSTLPE